MGRLLRILGLLILLSTGIARAQNADPPRSFEAVALSTSKVRCYWLKSANAVGYRISVDGQLLRELPADAEQCDIDSLKAGEQHTYSIEAVGTGGVSLPCTYVERSFDTFPAGPADPKNKRNALPEATFDVVIVQASSGGVGPAYEATKRGLRAALIEPTYRLGGMPANGLSATDLRRNEDASGFLVRFLDRVKQLYANEGVKTNGIRYEPRIAQQAIKSLIYENGGLTIYRRSRLVSVETAVVPPNPPKLVLPKSLPSSLRLSQQLPEDAPSVRKRVVSIVFEELDAEGKPTGRKARLRAGVFIDSTDCGDLAAMAGAPFRVGREPRSKEEPHNGVIYYNRATKLPLPGSTGKGDHRIQAYAYLVTVKDFGKGSDKTIPKPASYRIEDFNRSPAWKESWAYSDGSMPEGKYELNDHPQGGDLQEINYGYPTASYKERDRIEKLYKERGLCYVYYIQTQLGMPNLGLPDDQYRESGNFSPLLYVREARRIIGEQLPTEADITFSRKIVRPESIGLGDYPMDSHAVRRKTDTDPRHLGEGEWWLYHLTPWHSLPLGIIVPKTLDNVYVTTAVSSTHVSYGTYREEPVRMAFGQAAAIAAGISLRYGLAGRDVPARQIQEELLAAPGNPVGDPNVQLVFYPDLKFDAPFYREIQLLSARGFQPDGEKFGPKAPTTRAELGRWLQLLAGRGVPTHLTEKNIPNAKLKQTGPVIMVRSQPTPFPTEQTDLQPALLLSEAPDASQPVTRAEFAANLMRVLMPGIDPNSNPLAGRYSDLTVRDTFWVERMANLGIDSRLWDGIDAQQPDNKLRFQPNKPITHTEAFAALYRAQLRLGPLFFDNPVDARNGRHILNIYGE